ncbi:MAG: DUF2383 domain-containing protein [Kofleriaceae bacterium]
MATTTEPTTAAKIIDRLNDLVQLDYDAVHAYAQAIEQIDDLDALDDLQTFRLDHERHIADLGLLIHALGGEPVKTGLDVQGQTIEALTRLRGATGNVGALRAMRSTEKLANRTYEKALHLDLPPQAREVVARNGEDEQLHLTAIEMHLERLTGGEAIDEDLGEDLEDDEAVDVEVVEARIERPL